MISRSISARRQACPLRVPSAEYPPGRASRHVAPVPAASLRPAARSLQAARAVPRIEASKHPARCRTILRADLLPSSIAPPDNYPPHQRATSTSTRSRRMEPSSVHRIHDDPVARLIIACRFIDGEGRGPFELRASLIVFSELVLFTSRTFFPSGVTKPCTTTSDGPIGLLGPRVCPRDGSYP